MSTELEIYSADEILFFERCKALTELHLKEFPEELGKYGYEAVFNAIATLELERLKKEHAEDYLIDFNDEIVEIEEIGEQEVIDITVDKDSLFYADGVLTKNSYATVFICDIVIGIITTEDFDLQNKICFKQLKNRYRDCKLNNKFFLGVNKAKMKLYDINDPNIESKQTLLIEQDEFSNLITPKRKRIEL